MVCTTVLSDVSALAQDSRGGSASLPGASDSRVRGCGT